MTRRLPPPEGAALTGGTAAAGAAVVGVTEAEEGEDLAATAGELMTLAFSLT